MALEASVQKKQEEKTVAAKAVTQPKPAISVHAVFKNAAMSPQKVRLVADLVRGLTVRQALDILSVTRKKAALMVRKSIQSAAASAEQNHAVSTDMLVVSRIMVDEGIKLPRFQIVSRGRVHRYVRRRSHILVELTEAR